MDFPVKLQFYLLILRLLSVSTDKLKNWIPAGVYPTIDAGWEQVKILHASHS